MVVLPSRIGNNECWVSEYCLLIFIHSFASCNVHQLCAQLGEQEATRVMKRLIICLWGLLAVHWQFIKITRETHAEVSLDQEEGTTYITFFPSQGCRPTRSDDQIYSLRNHLCKHGIFDSALSTICRCEHDMTTPSGKSHTPIQEKDGNVWPGEEL